MNAKSFDARATVVVCSCDKYSDLLRPFAELWRKFWPDCPFETVLVTETALPEPLCFNRIFACGGAKSWCERLVESLAKIRTPYILMLCDDYYLSRPVDTAQILKRLDQIEQFKAANLRMIPNPVPGAANSEDFAEDSTLRRYRNHTAYAIATQAGFWKRQFLLDLARGKDSIWEFERYGSFDPLAASVPLLVTVTKEFPFLDAVHKGYWEKFGLECCLENHLDLSQIRRTLPPLKIRLREGLKAILFRLLPLNLLVRLQNRFSLGAK